MNEDFAAHRVRANTRWAQWGSRRLRICGFRVIRALKPTTRIELQRTRACCLDEPHLEHVIRNNNVTFCTDVGRQPQPGSARRKPRCPTALPIRQDFASIRRNPATSTPCLRLLKRGASERGRFGELPVEHGLPLPLRCLLSDQSSRHRHMCVFEFKTRVDRPLLCPFYPSRVRSSCRQYIVRPSVSWTVASAVADVRSDRYPDARTRDWREHGEFSIVGRS